MKKEQTTLILFILLAVLAFAPMVQEHLHVPRVKPLAGVTQEVKIPKLTWKNVQSGHFQRTLEQYVRQHYGYRPNTIRLYNQYLWDCYHKTYNKSMIAFGKEGWLYEPWFVEDYYHGGTYNQGKDSLTLATALNDEAFRLYQLQHILEDYGTTLLVCQAPGKDLIYPEYLPDDTVTTRPKTLSARDHYEAKFNALNLNHINMEQWFLQMKDTACFDLFPQKGTHWSNLAALYAADSLFRYIEAKKGYPLNQLAIGAPYQDKPRKPDYDLEELLNLVRPLPKRPLHYADIHVEPLPQAVKPKMIVIGDSFYWNLCLQIPMDSLFSAAPYWYYNSTIHFDSLHRSTQEVDLVEELLTADVVMILYSSTQLYKMSDGFSKQALLALCCDEEDLHQAEAACIRNIHNSPRWLADIQQRAETYHKPLDEFIAGEAANQVRSNPSYFFPTLRDSIPSKRSARVAELQSSAHPNAIIQPQEP